MRPPRWGDPIGSACREAEPTILRGLGVRPTLYGFRDGEPVIRVQPGLMVIDGGRQLVSKHLAMLVPTLGLQQLLLFSEARLTDVDIEDEDLRAVLATYGIAVATAERIGDQITTTCHLLAREVADGAVRWGPPHATPDGLWTHLLRGSLEDAAPHDAGIDTAGIVYALSRAGTVIEVAEGWRDRFGCARLDHRTVRPVDRRRARDLDRRRRGDGSRRGAREVAS